MLFNSYEFILVFLPATIVGFLLLGLMSRNLALGWLIVASVAFYAWWRPFNLAIIGPSLVVNFILGRWLLTLAGRDDKKSERAIALTVGILFNVAFLGYFKYANFAVQVTNDIASTSFVLEQIILPLGISFITFQKIAFLIDIAGGRIKSFTVRDFLLFVMFFPQLIAGPIVHYHESVPQFQKANARFDKTMYATALTLFVFGLFKKVVLADGIAEHVSPVFAAAASGAETSLLDSWLAAVGYTLQIYFDFSGYSDMACGAALFFGIKLPMNFDSPLKARNMIEFWLRWHITLTRFLTAYVYTPLTLWLIRARAAKKLPPFKGRGSKLTAFFQVLAFPTLATFLLSGVWHGAGYTFIIWGLLHGIYLVIAHGWRQYGPKAKPAKAAAPAGGAAPAPVAMSMAPSFLSKMIAPLIAWGVTFVCIVVSMVFFRAPDVATAGTVLQGMAGLQGLGLHDIPKAELAFLAGLLGIAMFMPNSLQFMAKFSPTLQGPPRPPKIAGIGPAIYWSSSIPWAGVIAAMAAISMWKLTGESEFLYWQF